MSESFETLGVSEDIMRAIEDMGFVEPTPVQLASVPVLMRGKDIMAQAQTGTGKTAAFGIPILQNLVRERRPSVLILVPTRELGMQVAEELKRLSKHMPHVSILAVYGGKSLDEQVERFRKGVDIIVGTPGRMIDHIKRRTIDLGTVSTLVLDEADRMLDMGFIDDIRYILARVPKQRQTMLFSATLPEGVREIAAKHMHEPEKIIISEVELTLPSTKQVYFNIERKNKIWALCRVLDKEKPKAMVFAQTKMMVDTIARVLKSYGYPAEAIHGDLTQAKREKVLRDFREGKVSILIATDVAARGLDIEGVTHVINFDIPEDPEVYVHRIGRTGRAGKEGMAITFITAREMHLLRKIEEFGTISMEEEQVPETGRRDTVRKRLDFEGEADIFGMVRFEIEVGDVNGLKKSDIYDALARKLRIPEMAIGTIDIERDSAIFELHKDAAVKTYGQLKEMTFKGKAWNLRALKARK
jgi:ATP-dependent RNA helicase DeaD